MVCTPCNYEIYINYTCVFQCCRSAYVGTRTVYMLSIARYGTLVLIIKCILRFWHNRAVLLVNYNRQDSSRCVYNSIYHENMHVITCLLTLRSNFKNGKGRTSIFRKFKRKQILPPLRRLLLPFQCMYDLQ